MSLTRGQQIMFSACQQFCVTRDELFSPCRKKRLVDARQYVAVRLSNELKMSRAAVGRFMHRDRSSVWGLLKRAERHV